MGKYDDMSRRCLTVVLATSLILPPGVLAAPQGGQITGGSGAISQSGTTTDVLQNSERMSVEWRSFDVDVDETVRFRQPSANAVAVNRILGDKPSEIRGRLQANGRVVLANSRGILFSESATVNVGALVAAGADLNADGFVRGDQDYLEFVAGADGLVLNRGLIEAASGVSLFGSSVGNVGDGAIMQGQLVHLGAGERAVVTFGADGMIGVSVSGETLARLSAAAVHNSGVIEAGTVVMDAAVSAGLFDAAVNNEGLVRASGIDTSGGKIRLRGSGGDVVNSGQLVAAGGEITVDGDRNIQLRDGSSIDVAANGGGGNVRIGTRADTGSVTVVSTAQINAQGIDHGDGGIVDVLAADRVTQRGAINARGGDNGGDGGQVELSAARLEIADGTVDTSAPRGETGTLLLDPGDFSIGTDPGSNDLSYANLEAALGSNNVTIATDPFAPGNGDIRFVDSGAVNVPAPRTLTLNAHRNVEFMGSFTSNGASLAVAINTDIDTNFSGDLMVMDRVVLTGGSFSADVISAILHAPIDTDNGSGSPGPVLMRALQTISLNSGSGVGGISSGINGSLIELFGDFDNDGTGDVVQQQDAMPVFGTTGIEIVGAQVGLFDVAAPAGLVSLDASDDIATIGTGTGIRADQLALRARSGINVRIDVNAVAAANDVGNIRIFNERALQVGNVDGLSGVAVTASTGSRTPLDIETVGDLSLLAAVSNADGGSVLLRAIDDTGGPANLLVDAAVNASGDGEIFIEANGNILFGAGANVQNQFGLINVTGAAMTMGPGPGPNGATSFVMAPGAVLQSGNAIRVAADSIELHNILAQNAIQAEGMVVDVRGDLQVNGTSALEIALNGDSITLFDGADLLSSGDITVGGDVFDFASSANSFLMQGSSSLTSTGGLVGIAADTIQLGSIAADTAIALFGNNGPGAIAMLPGTELVAQALLVQNQGDATLVTRVDRVAGDVFGVLQIDNSGPLEISNIANGEFGLPFGANGLHVDGLTIVNDAALTVAAPVDSVGAIELRVDDSLATTDDLLLNASIESDTDTIRLLAGDAITAIGSFVEAAIDIIVTAGHGNVDGAASDIALNDGSVLDAGNRAVLTATGVITNNDGLLTSLTGLAFTDPALDEAGKLQALLRGDDNFLLTQDGAIVPSGGGQPLLITDVRALRGELSAGTGIDLDTQVGQLVADTTAGDVALFNLDADRQFRVGDRVGGAPGQGISTGAGSIMVGATSALVLQGNIELLAPGDISLVVADRPDFLDRENLVIDALVRTVDGDILLAAGDALSINHDSLFARGDLTLQAGYLDVDGLASDLTTQVGQPSFIFASGIMKLDGPGDIEVGRLRGGGLVDINALGAINDASPFSDADPVNLLNPETNNSQLLSPINIEAPQIRLVGNAIGFDASAADLNISTAGVFNATAAQSLFVSADSILNVGAVSAGMVAALKAPTLLDGDAAQRVVATDIILAGDQIGSSGNPLGLQLTGLLSADTAAVAGDQFLDVSGDVTIDRLRAFNPVSGSGGTIELVASGIIDRAPGPPQNVEADALAVAAQGGIDLLTMVENLAASSARGSVLLMNSTPGGGSAPLVITSVGGINGVTTGISGDSDSGGDIVVGHVGPLNILAPVTNEDGGSITLRAAPGPASELLVAAAVTAGASGSVALEAVDLITVQGGATVATDSGGILVSGGGTSNTRELLMAPTGRLQSNTGAIDVFADAATIGEVVTAGATNVASDLLTIGSSILRTGTAALQLVANEVVQLAGVVLGTEDGDITLRASGGGPAQRLTMEAGSRMQTVTGDIKLDAGTMSLADIASGGTVSLLGGSAAGTIASLGGTRITANSGGVGSALFVDNRGDVELLTAVDTLSARVTGGNLAVNNQGSLVLVAQGPGAAAVTVPDGTVSITTASPLSVGAAISALGDITLQAGESAGTGDDLSLTANVTSTGGSVQLQAGDNIAHTGGNVSAADAVMMTAGMGDTDGISAVTMSAGSSANAAGNIGVTAGGNVVVSSLDAGAALSINSDAGNIADDGFTGSVLRGGSLQLSAANGIGAGGALGVDTTNISATAGSGAARINNVSVLETLLQSMTSDNDVEYSQLGGGLRVALNAITRGRNVNLSVGNLNNQGSIQAPAGQVDIALGGGGASTLGAIGANSTTVTGSAGNDSITVDRNITGDFLVLMGDGDDQMTMVGPLALAMNADLGDGADTVNISGGTVSLGGNIDSGSGVDSFSINSMVSDGTLLAGTGDDAFTFGDAGAANVVGGAGTDTLTVGGTTSNLFDISSSTTQVSDSGGVRITSSTVETLADTSTSAPSVSSGGAAVTIDRGNQINFSSGDAQLLTFNSGAGGQLTVTSPDIAVTELQLNNGSVLFNGVSDGVVTGTTETNQLTAQRLSVINMSGVTLNTDVNSVNLASSGDIVLQNLGTMLVENVATDGGVDLRVIDGDLLSRVNNGTPVIRAAVIRLSASGDIGNRADPFSLRGESVRLQGRRIVTPTIFGGGRVILVGNVVQSLTQLLAVSGINGAVQTLLKELGSVDPAIFTALLPFSADEEAVRVALLELQRRGLLSQGDIEVLVTPLTEVLQRNQV